MELDCMLSSENGNVIIRNRRHLILTDEMPAFTELSEGVAPLQFTNLSKPVTSLTTINHLKSIAPNVTKITQS